MLAGESLRSVAIDLSDRGLGQRSGGRWPGGATWGQRITAPHVAGLRVHRGKIVSETTWEPILDRETWDRLVALRADPSRRTQSGAPARMLLSGGIAKCGKCGRNLRSRTSPTGTPRYGCVPDGGACGGIVRVAEPIEAFVGEAVLKRLERSELGSLAPVETDLAVLDEELSTVDAKLGALATAWAADTLSQSEWDAARAGLTQRRSECKLAVARLRWPDSLISAHRRPAAASSARAARLRRSTDGTSECGRLRTQPRSRRSR